MTIKEAVNLLTVKHLENKVKKWIREAYALHEVCRIADSQMTYHPSNLQQTCNHVATNADKIRTMSDEEIAKWALDNCNCPPPFDGGFCPYLKGNTQTKSCKSCWLDWLKQEAQND